MVETSLYTRIGAPTAPDNVQRLRDPQRGHGAEPRGHVPASESPSAPQASLLVLPILAPEVLIAAQQARAPERDQVPDQDADTASDAPQQGSENKSKSADEAEQSAGTDAETKVVPLFANAVLSVPQSSITPPTRPLSEQFSPSDSPSGSADNGERSAFNRANQAYVSAGAVDGRTFGAAVFEPVSVSTTHTPINLVV